MRDAQLNTRASVRTLAESASPISISARLFVGLAVLARLAIKSVRAGRRINCSVYRLSSLSSGSGRALAQPTGRRPEHRRLQRWPSSSRAEAKRHTGHHIVVCARRLRRTLCRYSWSSHPHRERAASAANAGFIFVLLQRVAHALGVGEGCAVTASYPEVRSDHHHANSFRTAPSLCADMIFGNDRGWAVLSGKSKSKKGTHSRDAGWR
jgi:hypothetical protein